MWVYQYKGSDDKDHIKCFINAQDVNKNFVDDIPFCSSIVYLACIDITTVQKDDQPYVNFVVTRNVTDFPKKESLLRSVLSLCASSNSLEYITGEWSINPNRDDHVNQFPEVKSVQFLVMDSDLNNQFDVEGRKCDHKLLCERHNLNNGKQFLIPRFAVLDVADDSLNIVEISYLHHEDEENNILKTYCEIVDPRTQKKTSLVIDNPLTLEH